VGIQLLHGVFSNFLNFSKKRRMFGFFKKKTEKEILSEKYEKLQKEAFQLSRTNRAAGDLKLAEAEAVLKLIENLK